jgi:hypothetical protein
MHIMAQIPRFFMIVIYLCAFVCPYKLNFSNFLHNFSDLVLKARDEMIFYMVTKAQKEMVKKRNDRKAAIKPADGHAKKPVYAHTMELAISIPLMVAEKWGAKYTSEDQIDKYITDMVSLLKKELTLEEGSSSSDGE